MAAVFANLAIAPPSPSYDARESGSAATATGYYEAGVAGPDLFSEHETRLAVIEHLHRNWDGRGSEAPAALAVALAREALAVLRALNFCPTKITASAEGGVGISFVHGARHAAIEFLNSGEVLTLMTGHPGGPEATLIEIDASPEPVLQELRDFVRG